MPEEAQTPRIGIRLFQTLSNGINKFRFRISEKEDLMTGLDRIEILVRGH